LGFPSDPLKGVIHPFLFPRFVLARRACFAEKISRWRIKPIWIFSARQTSALPALPSKTPCCLLVVSLSCNRGSKAKAINQDQRKGGQHGVLEAQFSDTSGGAGLALCGRIGRQDEAGEIGKVSKAL
jgi:hypothetical protein